MSRSLGRLGGARWQLDLGDQHVERTGQPGRQVGDVAAGVGHHPGHRRDDAEPVGAVHAEHVRLARRLRALLRPDRPYGGQQSAVGGERAQRRLHVGRVGAGADQGHREVPAQPGHRRVGEVGAEVGEHVGDIGDDAGPVTADAR